MFCFEVFGRGFVLFGLLFVEPKLQSDDLVWYLFIVWSVIEVMRFGEFFLSSFLSSL